MTLTLQVKDANQLLPAQDTSRVLESGILTIGRGGENDWVLPDPERVISKQHCVIEVGNGGFLLTDTSSNGVFLNAAATPVGRGNSVALNDGDQFRISHFEITATVAADELPIAAPSQAAMDPYSSGEPAVLPDELPFDGDALSGILGDSDEADPFDTSLAQSMADPLPDDDFLGDGPRRERADDDAAMSLDHVPAGQDLLQVPEPMPEIPSDWDDEFTGGDESDLSPEAEAAEAWPDDDPFSGGAAVPATPARAAEPQAPAGPPPDPEPPRQAPVRAAPTRPSGPPAATEAAALKAFLAGAGLDELEIPERNVEETLKMLGALYRTTIQGLMEVLATRSSIKNEFRLSQTTIQPVENNPLKFSLGVDDAMTALLTKQGRGYMPPLAAVEESFDDIKAHQVAVLAGMQVALTGLLARFDPQTLQGRIEEDKGIAKLLTGKKARYWDEFTKLYERLVVEAEDDFHSIFGREFGRAYEEQVRKQGRRDT